MEIISIIGYNCGMENLFLIGLDYDKLSRLNIPDRLSVIRVNPSFIQPEGDNLEVLKHDSLVMASLFALNRNKSLVRVVFSRDLNIIPCNRYTFKDDRQSGTKIISVELNNRCKQIYTPVAKQAEDPRVGVPSIIYYLTSEPDKGLVSEKKVG